MRRTLLGTVAAAIIGTLAATPVSCQSVDVQRGELEGAPFRIQMPSRWGGGLVMYAHGYRPRGASWSPLADVLSRVFLDRGFALAESGYSRQGWAVEEGIHDTERLRRHFVELHGEPDSTFVAGHSLGGLIALATIESYPEQYVGALPMCAPMVPAIHFFEDSVFDMLVTFEAIFGSSLPEQSKPVVEVAALTRETVEATLESSPAAADDFARYWGVRREDLSRTVALYHLLYRELAERAGGNPIDNRDTIYSGIGPEGRLNEAVRRYAADSTALEYARWYYTPTGRLEDPVLAVHTTYDPGVPPRMANYYDVTVSLMGTQDWFVLKRVNADGHCNIGPRQMGLAFDQLRAWVGQGIRPEAGLLK